MVQPTLKFPPWYYLPGCSLYLCNYRRFSVVSIAIFVPQNVPFQCLYILYYKILLQQGNKENGANFLIKKKAEGILLEYYDNAGTDAMAEISTHFSNFESNLRHQNCPHHSNDLHAFKTGRIRNFSRLRNLTFLTHLILEQKVPFIIKMADKNGRVQIT